MFSSQTCMKRSNATPGTSAMGERGVAVAAVARIWLTAGSMVFSGGSAGPEELAPAARWAAARKRMEYSMVAVVSVPVSGLLIQTAVLGEGLERTENL